MSIEKAGVIDLLWVDPTEHVVLQISDHLEWSGDDKNDLKHMWLLQEKVNKYLAFVESGEIYDSQPQCRGKKIRIRVVGKYALSSKAEAFYKQVTAIVEGADIGFGFEVFDPTLQ